MEIVFKPPDDSDQLCIEKWAKDEILWVHRREWVPSVGPKLPSVYRLIQGPSMPIQGLAGNPCDVLRFE